MAPPLRKHVIHFISVIHTHTYIQVQKYPLYGRDSAADILPDRDRRQMVVTGPRECYHPAEFKVKEEGRAARHGSPSMTSHSGRYNPRDHNQNLADWVEIGSI